MGLEEGADEGEEEEGADEGEEGTGVGAEEEGTGVGAVDTDIRSTMFGAFVPPNPVMELILYSGEIKLPFVKCSTEDSLLVDEIKNWTY